MTAQTGKHTLKVVATDNDDETGSATVSLTMQSSMTLMISSEFNEGGVLPSGWTTYDGSERRSGFSNGYTSGSRVLQFTGTSRGLDYGLYFRNVNGNARQGWAKYGLSDGGTTLSLAPGHYTLRYKICNWNMPDFGSVELNIEKRAGNVSIAKQIYTPTVNIGNVASNNFGSLKSRSLEFDVTEKDDYVIALYTSDVEWGDCILGQLILTANSYVATGIEAPQSASHLLNRRYYTLQGQEVESPTQGVYIHNGKKVYIR